MAAPEIDLLAIERGAVTAPAGCGKTHLIAQAIASHSGTKPILVLTHTNAGVVALRQRLDRAGVPAKAYRLCTIDGWAMRLISTFPARSGHNPDILRLENPAGNYPQIRDFAARLLASGHVNDILAASYARLIVDEYQDCSQRQHVLVAWAAQVLPTCVLGDPMQAIFGFGQDQLAHWDQAICAYFPVVGELATPWRWINANAEALGRWLLDARGKLVRGEAIDLRTAPPAVSWVALDGTQDHERRLAAARTRPASDAGSTLIIGDSTSPDSQRRFASQTPGAITIEAVDLKDLVHFARNFIPASPNALAQLVQFAESVMINVASADFLRRVASLSQGTARTQPSEAESAALTFLQTRTHRAAVYVLVEIGKQPGVRSHRPAVLGACIRSLNACDGAGAPSFYDAAVRMREQNRQVGRPLPKRAVGSTLLLKGLEAEVAVILNADGLNTQNLYVAMTRGSQRLVVCSSLPLLTP